MLLTLLSAELAQSNAQQPKSQTGQNGRGKTSTSSARPFATPLNAIPAIRMTRTPNRRPSAAAGSAQSAQISCPTPVSNPMNSGPKPSLSR